MMKKILICLLLTYPGILCAQKDRSLQQISETYNWTSWGNNRLPKDCPLPLSKTFGGISFTGRFASYTNADTWYPAYASDGTIYSCFTDGSVNGQGTGSPNPWSGRIVGSDPLNLQVDVVGERVSHNGNEKIAGKYGRYPCAQLMYNDIWYYGTYLLEQNDRSWFVPNADWPILQPFVGFRVSDNFGGDWFDQTTPEFPLLENPHDKWVRVHGVEFYNPYEVMIGAPHFVDFGRNLEHAPIDKQTGRRWAYMVAHGADAGCKLAHNSWISGDNIYLLRILMPEGRNAQENFRYMNDAGNWQYLSRDGSYRTWNRNDLQEVYRHIKPIVDATGYLGNVGLTYNAALGRFIMTLSRVDDADRDFFNTLILESEAIDGKYRVVQYLKGFATISYFMNIPSPFISEDGRTMWLCYSSNYNYKNNPLPTIGGSQYSMCLTEFTLDGRDEAKACKYEAEGMQRLGHTSLLINTGLSNGAGVADISRLGDGLEFYSKSRGNALAVAVLSKLSASKRLSVYRNGRFCAKLLAEPSGDIDECHLYYVSMRIRPGDRISLRMDADDIAYNSLQGELPDGEHHFFGDIDYAVVDQVEFRGSQVVNARYRPLSVETEVMLQSDGSIDACQTRLHGTAKVMNVHPGYTGRGFVAGLDVLGKKGSVSFVPSLESGDYELCITYSAGPMNASWDRRELTLSVGTEKSTQQFPLTETWQQWREKKILIHYTKGDKIKLSADRLGDNEDCINIDRFTFRK